MVQAAGISGGATGPWYRVQALSASCLGGSADRDYAAILPAALNAAAQRRPFIAGWLSRGGGAPLELITNAGPLPGDDATGRHELLFPWGAHGQPMAGNVLADLDRLVWGPCPVRQAPLTRPDEGWRPEDGPTRFESALQTLMGRAFGWLIVADPVDHIDAETEELRSQLNILRRYEEEQARFDVERAQRRLAELDNYREAGLWELRVLAGAATEQELGLIAPVLAGAVDLRAHPYRLRSAEGAREFADALAAKLSDPGDGSVVPFAATAGALAALTGLPRGEVPGIRVLDSGFFDVTSEMGDEQSIELGEILDGQDRPVGTFRVPLETLNRHAFVTGATGAGKSQTIRHMLEQLTAAGVHWLAIEPVKSEYASMAGRIEGASDVTVINPADPGAVPVSVNPLAPEPGYPVQAHIDMVRALFLAAFDAHEPFPADHVAGAAARLQRLRLGRGDRRRAARRGRAADSPDAGPAGGRRPGRHPGGRLRPGAPGRRARVRRRAAPLAAHRVGRPVLRGRPPGRHRRAAAPQRGAGHRGRGQRRGQGVPDRHPDHPDRRAPADAGQGCTARRPAPRRGHRGGAPAAAGRAGGPERPRGRAVRQPAGRDPRLRRGHRHRRADPGQADPGRGQEHGPQGAAPAARGRRPGRGRGRDEPGREPVPAGGVDAARHRGRLRRRDGPAAADPGAAGRVPGAGRPPHASHPPIRGRRSAACGPTCTAGRACTLLEIRAADVLASSADDAWLRVWAEALVLAHLTNRPLPRVPAVLRHRWLELDARLRECLLATALDRPLAGRATAVRAAYDPERFAAACAMTARRLLDGGQGAGSVPGADWVIPQLQWLHEIERACPLLGPQPDPFGAAPRLDFALPGLADRADVKIGQRVSGLRRHPLSMELARNRLPAWTVLLGEDDQQGFIEDLGAVAIGFSHRGQLRKAAGEMGIAGWLEPVLSWPRRFIIGADDQAVADSVRQSAVSAG